MMCRLTLLIPLVFILIAFYYVEKYSSRLNILVQLPSSIRFNPPPMNSNNIKQTRHYVPNSGNTVSVKLSKN